MVAKELHTLSIWSGCSFEGRHPGWVRSGPVCICFCAILHHKPSAKSRSKSPWSQRKSNKTQPICMMKNISVLFSSSRFRLCQWKTHHARFTPQATRIPISFSFQLGEYVWKLAVDALLESSKTKQTQKQLSRSCDAAHRFSVLPGLKDTLTVASHHQENQRFCKIHCPYRFSNGVWMYGDVCVCVCVCGIPRHIGNKRSCPVQSPNATQSRGMQARRFQNVVNPPPPTPPHNTHTH